MTKICANEKKIIGQTLFLGASVQSFNNSVGWGSQPSQLTINLVEDESPCSNQSQFDTHSKTALNHYHDCTGDDCYVLSDGTNYNSTNHDPSYRMVPGKVYYSIETTTTSPVVSRYWTTADPGFFGRKTKIKPDGSQETTAGTSYQYDLINTPVYFKTADFTFCGLVQSWNRNLSSGGKNYTVVVQSMQSLLNSCYIIIDKYAGAIFSKKTGSTYGSPKNYLSTTGVSYTGSISEGNLPNVFNVYGFLESFGLGGFGSSYVNERGMSVNQIIRALHVLTSSVSSVGQTNGLDVVLGTQAPRRAYSPFGRIIAKHAQLDAKSVINNTTLTVSNIYDTVSLNNFGIIPPSASGYCEFLLDLSELPDTPDDFRIQGPVISIMEFINTVAEQTGHDIYIDTIPIKNGTTIQYVIKVKTISRLSQPQPNSIENTIKQFECNNYAITSDSIGKEKNETNSRSLIIGGPQQRLYQAKSYRLAYTQNNFIYNDQTGKFIDYMQLGSTNNTARTSVGAKQFHHGKIKKPNFLTTRNMRLNTTYYSAILDDEDAIQQQFTAGFEADDTVWSDSEQTGPSSIGSSARWNGNYIGSYLVKQEDNDAASWGLNNNERWFPIHMDIICPFFGFVNEEELTLKISKDSSMSDTRKVRPVWFDTWTGQIVVVLNVNELPEISVPLMSSYASSSTSCSSSSGGGQAVTQPTATAIISRDGTGSISSIDITNPGNNIKGTVSVSISGDGTGATATAVVTGGKVRSITVKNRGKNYKSSVSVTLTVNAQNSNCLPSGRTQATSTGQFFLLTESEIRAALAGFDNFLVYSLAKLYKPDLIEMVRNAYKTKIINRLVNKGETTTEATKIAEQKTEWYWTQESTNIASEAEGHPSPSFLVADKPDGSQYIPDDAVHDLQILHKFITEIGKYYGKKYMVTATNVVSYKDQDFSGIALPTSIGTAYVFNGAGNLRYNYLPTNDGAWEEYGNFIDDSIVVGSSHWFNLSDDKGKIKPILGYNANRYFDYQRYMICQQADTDIDRYKAEERAGPYWDYMAYLNLIEDRNTQCNNNDFVFSLLDTSTLGAKDYIITDVISNNSPSSLGPIDVNSLPTTDSFSRIPGYDAYGTSLGLNKQKLYINTTVEEDFIYLDAENKAFPKFLIDAPGITLNHSSTKNTQDPSRTVIANTSIEDVAIYMRTHSAWDMDWIYHMLSYTRSLTKTGTVTSTLSLYRNTSNQSALQVEIAPKMAHPFFAGIPVKSNQFTYGPWTNYPYLEYSLDSASVFPTGEIIIQDTGIPPACSTTAISIGANSAANAINNWITPINIEVKEDFVPWSYGGMSFLDAVAYKEIETKINYENIVETAQVEIPGLPIFNLGGNFSYGNLGPVSYVTRTYIAKFFDEKFTSQAYPALAYAVSGLRVNNYAPDTITSNSIDFNILTINTSNPVTRGPIITNIQTGISQQGLSTTYSFRTYTRKLGLFNKEESDRIRRFASENFRRARQLAELRQEMNNVISQQRKFLDDQRMSSAQFGSKDFRSKLFGWSPAKVLIARSSPYFPEPKRDPNRINESGITLQSNPGDLDTLDDTPTSWNMPARTNTSSSFAAFWANNGREKAEFDDAKTNSVTSEFLGRAARFKTDVGIYERKEVDAELKDQYGTKAAMSLDGLLSPISFYPTFKNSTFAYSKYLTQHCPFCNGTKIRTVHISAYADGNFPDRTSISYYKVVCDKCVGGHEKLDVILKGQSANGGSAVSSEKLPPYIVTSGSDFQTLLAFNNFGTTSSISSSSSSNSPSSSTIPINLISLNPILVNHGEFRNTSAQTYSETYTGIHEKFTGRVFFDRCQHCIEIVARGAVPVSEYKYKLETSKNIISFDKLGDQTAANPDYFSYDKIFQQYMYKLDGSNNPVENNQRFLGLRGPLVMHGWGFDTDGYPVPNASEEPYSQDAQGRRLRFKLKITVGSTQIASDKMIPGESYIGSSSYSAGAIIYGQPYNTNNYTNQAGNIVGTVYNRSGPVPPANVYKITIEDDLNQDGGYDPGNNSDLLDGYKGSVISKTQKWDGSKWSTKKKMKEFFLNWGERPDLWPVGPIDLRWDAARRVWTGGGGGSTYKMVYATLEEDLVREDDFVETYPARAFLDDIEYSKDNLPLNYRRLIYIKDKSGFTAPKGVKLLCRYDSDSGFYEPVSKPSIVAMGIIDVGNRVKIDMTYAQGRQSGQIPSTMATFDNPFGFSVAVGKKGLFTYIAGKWTLTTIQQN